ncbi:MAG: proline--tRNA ligase [Candidatus Andersenbacteria bacterium]|nr:proline--tRNA ligase [bacterium]MDZ4225357.1 proline--tRNA ligase [Candidatus Andersenbacteria bacterium]
MSNNTKITPQAENFAQWYQDVITAADLAENSSVRGCMVIKPYGYAIWENIRKELDSQFQKQGVENAYFPLLIPEKFLQKEAEHIKGFSPELAVVTYGGGKELTEPLVIRPTSETIIYDAFSRWIHSYRDLPLRINQWANVVRWEMRPRLFLRTTEFLWQEGHTAHATKREARQYALKILKKVYKPFAEKHLAMAVIDGQKTESEKFAGALSTYSIETLMRDGKFLQSGTSHDLSDHFAKAFNVRYLSEDGTQQYVYNTSWGVSTRLIGGLVMSHGDDKGIVLPPKIAPHKIVIVPIANSAPSDVTDAAKKMYRHLKKYNPIFDDRLEVRPGEKFYEWEKKGVPLRLELGPKDLANNKVVLVRRDTGEKSIVANDDVKKSVENMLKDIQNNLLLRSQKLLETKARRVDTWDEFVREINAGNYVLAHWSGDAAIERQIKEETKATIRCIPFKAEKEKGLCIKSGKPSRQRVVFGRAY